MPILAHASISPCFFRPISASCVARCSAAAYLRPGPLGSAPLGFSRKFALSQHQQSNKSKRQPFPLLHELCAARHVGHVRAFPESRLVYKAL